MEIVDTLRRLWSLRLWVAGAAVIAVIAGLSTGYRFHAGSPFLEEKSLEFGVAQTQLLIDAERTAVGNLKWDLTPFTARANVFATFLKNESVQRKIAREAGVPPGVLVIEGASNSASTTRSEAEPDGSERGNDLLYEGAEYRLAISATPELPILNLSAEAPTADEAVKLANSTWVAVDKYLTRLQDRDRIAMRSRVKIRQLGTAQGGVVNEGASKRTALITTVGVFGLLILLTLLISRVVVEVRRQSVHADELHATDDLLRPVLNENDPVKAKRGGFAA